MDATDLHTYRCSFCKTVATFPMRASLLKCVVCLRWLTWLYATPITTDEQRALADRGLVFNPHMVGVVNTKRPCDQCKQWVEKDAMIRLGVGGKYCSQPCADLGTEKHRAAMERMDERLNKLYSDMPWLRPQVKESA